MTVDLAHPSRPQPPCYLLLTFWGDQFRDFTCRLALPSLLSAGNIPALRNRDSAKFLIATTAADWAKLQDEPIFRAIEREITVEFLSNEDRDRPIHKYTRMSQGHAMLADRCFRDKAVAININPDSIYPDDCIAQAMNLFDGGKDVILCAAVRVEMEGVEKELTAAVKMAPGQPIVLPMREATAVGLRNMHPETLAS